VSRERWIAVAFGIGSACFFIGPFPAYAQLVGARADGITFFVGSLFFTSTARVACPVSGSPERGDAPGRADLHASRT
jgi:hypothetical protein